MMPSTVANKNLGAPLVSKLVICQRGGDDGSFRVKDRVIEEGGADVPDNNTSTGVSLFVAWAPVPEK
jgi:hypothetical protein